MDVQAIEQRYINNESLKQDINTQQLYDSIQGIQQEEADLLKITLDSSQLIIELENKLRGRIQVWNETKKELVWKQVTTPVMNDEGINAYLQEVITRVSRDQILANLDADEVRARMQRLIHNVTAMTMAKSTDYELDLIRRSNVNDMVYGIVHNHMTRSIGRAEGRDVYGRTKAIEHLQRTTANQDNKSWSIFGRREGQQ